MKILNIRSSARAYPIYLGDGLLAQLPELISKHIKSKKVFLIGDEHVLGIYKPQIIEIFKLENLHLEIFSLPQGERTKSNEYIQSAYQWLIENKCDRYSTIVALGGGVIGDAVGFVASTYLRGIPFVQVPTTLLSMVDSSIGGKVGINHKLGKNLIGSFYPPHLVVQDVQVLKTLEKREFNSGIAECIKHTLINSSEFFHWTSRKSVEILNLNSDLLAELITKNLEVKSGIVEKDEKEENIRAFLNLGHTFGHAIEKEFGYSNKILHGEGVSLGLVAALKLSEELLGLDKNVLIDTKILLEKFNLPIKFKLPEFSTILESMSRDKKNRSGEINFVLLSEIGKPQIYRAVDEKTLLSAYKEISL